MQLVSHGLNIMLHAQFKGTFGETGIVLVSTDVFNLDMFMMWHLEFLQSAMYLQLEFKGDIFIVDVSVYYGDCFNTGKKIK